MKRKEFGKCLFCDPDRCENTVVAVTIAGQILMEGFLDLKIPCYQRRMITRALALIPAFLAVWLMGEGAVGKLLVFSQVVLSFQLPFAIFPLLRLSGDTKVMGVFANSLAIKFVAWSVFGLITAANLWLVFKVIAYVVACAKQKH